MKRFWAIFKKEIRQIGRDPLSLGMLVLLPALLLALYGYALSFDVKHIRVAVLDEDRTQESRRLLDSMFQNPYFDRAVTLERRSEIDDLLNRGVARAALIIPKGFARDMAKGKGVNLQTLVDGADASTANTTIGYFDLLAAQLTRQFSIAFASGAGAVQVPAVLPQPRIWFNPELSSAHFLVPGLIGMLLMLSCVIATSLSIVREKERETIEQIMVSPIRPEELIMGKTLPYVFISAVTMAMILLLGYLLFGIQMKGSWMLLCLSTLVFLFAGLGMGVMISSVTQSQQVAFQVAVLSTLLPSLILSGLIFPIKNMPIVIQAFTYVVIPRYFVHALREIILKAAPLRVIYPDLLAMLVLGILFNLLAARNTKKAI